MTEQMDKHETVETDALQSADADVSGDQETFTPRQQQLLVALVRDANVQVAAQAVGVSRTTAHQWMKQPAFQEELTGGGGDATSNQNSTPAASGWLRASASN